GATVPGADAAKPWSSSNQSDRCATTRVSGSCLAVSGQPPLYGTKQSDMGTSFPDGTRKSVRREPNMIPKTRCSLILLALAISAWGTRAQGPVQEPLPAPAPSAPSAPPPAWPAPFPPSATLPMPGPPGPLPAVPPPPMGSLAPYQDNNGGLLVGDP